MKFKIHTERENFPFIALIINKLYSCIEISDQQQKHRVLDTSNLST